MVSRLWTLALIFIVEGLLHKSRSPYRSKHVIFSSTENTDGLKTPEPSVLQELDDNFEYEGRLTGADSDFRCGFVTIMGAPNQGKSTLLNALLEEDLCIATARPQTTRHAILGLLSTDNCQVCLTDTPGVIGTPAYALQEGMMEAVHGAVRTSDVLVVVSDLFSTPIPDDDLFLQVQKQQHYKPVMVVINKVDLVDKINLDSEVNAEKTVSVAQAVARWRELLPSAMVIIPISASQPDHPGVTTLRKILTGGPDVPAAIRDLGRPISGMFPGGVKTLDDEACRNLLPLSPPLYNPEYLTDRPERFLASEMIRAALFEQLKKELPYCCEVRIQAFKEPQNDKEKIRIDADVLVERDSQKVIVIGKGGAQIKQIGTTARQALEDFFQHSIVLNLSVKVSPNWRKKTDKLLEFGYLKKANKKK